MKQSAFTYFPLLILAILAGLSFWLEQATDVPLIRDDGKTRHDPDTLADNLVIHRYGPEGRLEYRLQAKHLAHYPDDDSSLVQAPLLTHTRPEAPDMVLSGKQALVTEQGKRILVQGDVVASRVSFAQSTALVARTAELTVLPEEGKAFNSLPVHITQGESWIKGVGLQLDNQAGTLSLDALVTGEYFSKAQTP